MNRIAYPRLIKRVRAVLVDSIIIPSAVFAGLGIGAALNVSHPLVKGALLVAPIFLLGPVLVAFTGGTIGQHLEGIRVTRMDGVRHINIFAATLRFIVKMGLGWLSFVFILATAKHQGLHDLVARSVVVHKSTTGLPDFEVLRDRSFEAAAYRYPAAWRRLLLIVVYSIAATVLVSVVNISVLPEACLQQYRCSALNSLFEMILGVAWIVGLAWIMVRCWTARLYGCRRRPREYAP
jgi:uncharacterized RDD family membrane protein YckC